MKDIEDRLDIQKLVTQFYKKATIDEKIGVFFTEVVKLNWDKHLPTMYDFWETTLLGIPKYKGNPMLKHIALHQKKPVESLHFNQWLFLWEETINEHFHGEVASKAVLKGNQIAQLMKYKVHNRYKLS